MVRPIRRLREHSGLLARLLTRLRENAASGCEWVDDALLDELELLDKDDVDDELDGDERICTCCGPLSRLKTGTRKDGTEFERLSSFCCCAAQLRASGVNAALGDGGGGGVDDERVKPKPPCDEVMSPPTVAGKKLMDALLGDGGAEWALLLL